MKNILKINKHIYFNIFIIQFYHYDSGGWIRFFNKGGFKIRNINKEPLLFSERNGYTKGITIFGKYYIGLLKKHNK